MAMPAGWRRWRAPLALLVTLTCVGIALTVFDWSRLSEMLMDVSLKDVFLALALCAMTQVLIGARWTVLVRVATRQAWISEMLLVLQASVFNLISPGALGADVYRVVQSRAHNRAVSRSTGLVLAERLFGIWAYAIVYVTALALGGAWRLLPDLFLWSGAILLAVAVGISGAGLIGIAPVARLFPAPRFRLVAVALSILTAATDFGYLRKAAAAALSVASLVTWVAAATVLCQAVGLELPPNQIAAIAVLTEFARLVPISIQGIGVREATFAALCALAGASSEAGFVACAILYALNILVVATIGAMVSIISARRAGVSQETQDLD